MAKRDNLSAGVARLVKRRSEVRLWWEPRSNPPVDMVGLALSGGGIRSATYSLGVIQALARAERDALSKMTSFRPSREGAISAASFAVSSCPTAPAALHPGVQGRAQNRPSDAGCNGARGAIRVCNASARQRTASARHQNPLQATCSATHCGGFANTRATLRPTDRPIWLSRSPTSPETGWRCSTFSCSRPSRFRRESSSSRRLQRSGRQRRKLPS